MKQEDILGLNGLRCLAVAAVIATHLGSYQWFVDRDAGQFHILVGGSTGVLLFFVLSGFLITTKELQRLKRNGSFSMKRFFIARALRIFPLYYFALACYLLIYALGLHDLGFVSMAFAVTYLYNFIPAVYSQSWLSSFHTLATEQHWYIVFPLLFAWAVRRKSIAFFVKILIGYIVAALIAYPYVAPLGKSFVEGVHRWTFFACIPILIGALAACLRESEAFARFRKLSDSSAALSAAFTLAALGLFLAGYLMQPYLFNETAMGVAFAALIFWVAERQKSAPTRLLSIKPLDYLGEISYGLYVWQSFIIATGPDDALITDVPLAIAAIVGLSMLTFHTFEKRFLKLKARHQEQKPAVAIY